MGLLYYLCELQPSQTKEHSATIVGLMCHVESTKWHLGLASYSYCGYKVPNYYEVSKFPPFWHNSSSYIDADAGFGPSIIK